MKIENKNEKKLYSIGDASKMTNLSNKTLRYYERIGLIIPDEVNEENGYRYYSKENLQDISIIKYYKQLGYTLNEIMEMKNSTRECFNEIIVNFQEKIRELKEKEYKIKNSLRAINDWYELIKEGKYIKNFKCQNVNLKYLGNEKYIYKEFEFDYDYRIKILNVEWVNYLENIKNKITGPVILKFSNYRDKVNGLIKKVKIIQKPIKEIENKNICEVSGGIYASIYHIGDLKTINNSYEKIIFWAKENNVELEDISYERYVIDFWTTNNSKDFITEILIQIKNKEIPLKNKDIY